MALSELVVLVIQDGVVNALNVQRVDPLLPLDVQPRHDVLPDVRPGVAQEQVLGNLGFGVRVQRSAKEILVQNRESIRYFYYCEKYWTF